MNEIGEDVKAAYQEVGTSYEVIRDALVASGEYLLYELNAQVTKPFVREYFLDASLPYDSSGEAGDVLRLRDGSCYLVMHKTPEDVENQVIGYSAGLYRANVSGELLRPSGEAWDAQYHKTTVFERVAANCYALLTESLFRYVMSEEDFGNLQITQNELYLPKRYGVRLNDRYSPQSGEYYKVGTIKKRGFLGVDVVMLEEDTR